MNCVNAPNTTTATKNASGPPVKTERLHMTHAQAFFIGAAA